MNSSTRGNLDSPTKHGSPNKRFFHRDLQNSAQHRKKEADHPQNETLTTQYGDIVYLRSGYLKEFKVKEKIPGL